MAIYLASSSTLSKFLSNKNHCSMNRLVRSMSSLVYPMLFITPISYTSENSRVVYATVKYCVSMEERRDFTSPVSSEVLSSMSFNIDSILKLYLFPR